MLTSGYCAGEFISTGGMLPHRPPVCVIQLSPGQFDEGCTGTDTTSPMGLPVETSLLVWLLQSDILKRLQLFRFPKYERIQGCIRGISLYIFMKISLSPFPCKASANPALIRPTEKETQKRQLISSNGKKQEEDISIIRNNQKSKEPLICPGLIPKKLKPWAHPRSEFISSWGTFLRRCRYHGA
jgi:hypothetical protein